MSQKFFASGYIMRCLWDGLGGDDLLWDRSLEAVHLPAFLVLFLPRNIYNCGVWSSWNERECVDSVSLTRGVGPVAWLSDRGKVSVRL